MDSKGGIATILAAVEKARGNQGPPEYPVQFDGDKLHCPKCKRQMALSENDTRDEVCSKAAHPGYCVAALDCKLAADRNSVLVRRGKDNG